MIRRICLALLGILLASAPAAMAATQLGVRGGYSHAAGDLFQGSGGLGGDGIYGFVASIGLLPALDLEFAYERYTKKFSFDRAAAEDVFFGGKGTYKDQAYLLTGKIHLPLVGAPFGLYGGAGGSLHRIDLHVNADAGSDESVDGYIHSQIDGARNEWEWHLVGGLQLKLPVLPLLAYAEYRYQDLSGKHNPSYSSIYGGLNLYLN
jgi:hypothetical protein